MLFLYICRWHATLEANFGWLDMYAVQHHNNSIAWDLTISSGHYDAHVKNCPVTKEHIDRYCYGVTVVICIPQKVEYYQRKKYKHYMLTISHKKCLVCDKELHTVQNMYYHAKMLHWAKWQYACDEAECDNFNKMCCKDIKEAVKHYAMSHARIFFWVQRARNS